MSAISCKALTSLLTYPHEVVRARQQYTRRAESDHTLRFVIGQLMKEGAGSFYSGYLTNLMRITPHYAITFVLYEYLSQKFHTLID